jgi:16S rRNA (guanine527-N7)-methyltransferase
MTITNRKYIGLSDARIRAAVKPYGGALTDAQVGCIRRYLSLLLLWNQKINLTSIRDPEEILRRHFGESMFASRVVPITAGRLVDVGSGAGFPGLALKIVCPEIDLAMIESNAKKAAFLSEVARVLDFRVEINRERFEKTTLAPASCDFITARALGGLPGLLKWSRIMLAEGGHIVLWLGADDAAKVSEASGWTWRQPISIPRSRRRALVVGQVGPV